MYDIPELNSDNNYTHVRENILSRLQVFSGELNHFILFSDDDTATILEALCRYAVGLGGFDSAWVLSLESATDTVSVETAEELVYDAFEDKLRDPELGAAWRAVLTDTYVRKTPYLCTDLAHDTQLGPVYHRTKTAPGCPSFAVFPFPREDRVVSVFLVFGPDLARYDAETSYILKTIVYDAAYAVNLAWMRWRQRQTEAEMAEIETRFRQLAETIDDVFWIRDETQYLYVSPAFVQVWGRERSELYRNPKLLLEVVHPEDKPAVLESMRNPEYQSTGVFSQEHRIVRPDGEIRWVWVRSFRVDVNSGNVKRAGIAQDITERKAIEDSLRRSAEEKETLLREVHHRVKNNLQVIVSLLNLQMNTLTDEVYRHILSDSQRRVMAIALVHETLYQQPTLNRINLREYIAVLVSDIITALDTGGKEPRVVTEIDAVTLEIDRAVPCGLIMNELLTNAVKYGQVSGRDSVIDVRFLRKDPLFELTIRDNGPGYPETVLSDQTGAGLGLKLVQALVSQIRGSIHMENCTEDQDPGLENSVSGPGGGTPSGSRYRHRGVGDAEDSSVTPPPVRRPAVRSGGASVRVVFPVEPSGKNR
jgi:PAS domain S-box-containing protein